MIDFTASARKSLVTNAWVNHSSPGDPLHPHWQKGEVWSVWVVAQIGLLPKSHHCFECQSEAEATKVMEFFPIGAEFKYSPTDFPCQAEAIRQHIEAIINAYAERGRNIPDYNERSPLAFDVLEAAGIMESRSISKMVINFLGEKRTKELERLYHANWGAAAIYQYCWLKLPHSSAAFVAASYMFHHYISGDDFTAGYNWRDLEIIANQVERDAIVGQGVRRAARAGGSARAAYSEPIRNKILEAMEALVADGRSVSTAAAIVANRGLGTSAGANRKLWDRYKTTT